MPELNGGSAGSEGVCRASSVSPSTASGAPSVRSPAIGRPSQRLRPAVPTRIEGQSTPTNDHRDQTPRSTDSSRKLPSRPPVSCW